MQSPHSFDLQIALGKYCRTGNKAPHSTRDANIFHYHRLVQNVMFEALDRPFPLTIQWIGSQNWQAAKDQFIAEHACAEPQIWKMPGEFLTYYQQHAFPFDSDVFPALIDLMHFEWLEVEVFMMEDELLLPFYKDGNLYQDILVPNPELRILSMPYPFHLKAPWNMKLSDKGAYFVTIHRNIDTKKVHFNNLSYPFVEMLLAIHDTDCRWNDLQKILLKFDADTSLNEQRVQQFLNFAFEQQLLVGFRNN